MTTFLDSSIGIARESAYGTVVTPNHFPEFLSESLEWKPTFVQGAGYRAGSGMARAERRVLGKNHGEGDIELEAVARGVGIFLEAWLGASTSTGIASLAAPAANGALSATTGGTLAAATYYVRSTWTTASGESLAAPETSLAVALNNVLNVAAPASPPVGATGWNVYVSSSAGTETRQNGSTPIALGAAWVEPTSGLVAGAALPSTGSAFVAYQQNFSLATSDPINSYTIQKGIPARDGGSVFQHTFAGAVCTKGELISAQGDTVKLKTSWNTKSVDTTTAYAAPSFVANNEVFWFNEGSIAIGGTVTAPTTTALASGGTSVADIRDFTLSLDSGLDAEGYTYGAAGKQGRKPVLGLRKGTGKLTAEFDNATLRDAYLNQSNLSILLTFTSGTALQSGVYNTLQVYIPTVRLEGELPKAANKAITQSINYTVLDASSVAAGGSGASPITVVLRTLDTVV